MLVLMLSDDNSYQQSNINPLQTGLPGSLFGGGSMVPPAVMLSCPSADPRWCPQKPAAEWFERVAGETSALELKG
jgi:hypothetical protein